MADIVCQDIHKYYGDNHILQGISFEIYEGERVGFLVKMEQEKPLFLIY